MADLAADRNTERREANTGSIGIAASKRVYVGLLCLVDSSGYAVCDVADAVACRGIIIDPRSDQDYDNSTGIDAAQNASFEFNKKAGLDVHATRPPTQAHIGYPVYASDNHTVSYSAEDGPEVGTLHSIVGSTAWVRICDNVGLHLERNYIRHATPQTLAAATAVVFKTGLSYFPIVGNAAPVTLTADLPDGDQVGREIFFIGGVGAGTDKVTVPDGIKTALIGGLSAELGLNDILALAWNGTNWVEMWRAIGH